MMTNTTNIIVFGFGVKFTTCARQPGGQTRLLQPASWVNLECEKAAISLFSSLSLWSKVSLLMSQAAFVRKQGSRME